MSSVRDYKVFLLDISGEPATMILENDNYIAFTC